MKAIVHPTPRLSGDIQALSSKNYTTRFLLAAALSEGTSTIYYPAQSEDGEAMRRCIRDLGARIEEDDQKIIITGFGKYPQQVKELNVGNAGAVLRFLMSVAAFCQEVTFVNAYPESLGKRPHDDLIHALEQMGVEVVNQDGRLPITIRGGEPRGGRIQVSGNVSSQFLSSILFIAPLLKEDSEIEVLHDLKSKIVIGQTLDVLKQAGIRVEASKDLMHYRIPGNQTYQPREYVVQGDYPGSATILAAAAVTESDVTVNNLEENSLQGERACIDVLRQMGVLLTHKDRQVQVKGNGRLKPVEFDGDEFTDAVLAMVAAAVFADGTTRFYNVENLRYKECDRITDFLTELRKAGASVEERQSEIIVHGKPEGVEGGVEIDAHIDHRVIMALSVVGLRSRKGLTIRDAQHVAKSYPHFFNHLQALGAHIELMN
ncbi:3-phosphoshikimate 1-carboxyvinyltransferase AroA [Paenibacillus larvae subsp. larvae]|uniref:3-phosphoshikimate 1-carboxyvinyltransferase n=1 Tax=Paenibacillus larvae subsp. larvae TaxID=147375 RepID=A0A2L1UFS8_9BACL|nr:3-phosphoshikimate 1-carboxyvinyltransferase [Paenibacillus larvae]AQZ48923.1 3-phosphoshikimate 1-carboxyvinyltransferase [Paenibacillus larvae subsp. pulvifaciens]AVF27036.1 3-phosphoshikimate 1-carboxyvinyltransferase AroA [Paenibacillus larvae subsp. larvae]AVF31783.1 3-phosphoshikimate 1-carboxyvinyltransferase AroA [Paenibacillus larvae subsp. larvae]MBH0344757.1 3-phosphoshikimate 1-carboxyvinyltransferase [Paenibacillus larvae]MCY7520174.1 3-phosphoshikimate 1-carboxyvinyltransferas